MSVCIEIGEHAITSDANCWSISKKVKSKDGTKWQAFKYYNNFDAAMRALFDMNVRCSGANSITELRQAMLKASESITEACAPLRSETALNTKGE